MCFGDIGIHSLRFHQPSKGWSADWSCTWLRIWSLSRSLGISHQMFSLSLHFSRSCKGQGTKIKGDAERFQVHSSPLIYWKFQHLNRRKKAKFTGILAGWQVIKKRCEFPQNKHTKARLLRTLTSPVILWLQWHACQGREGKKLGERQKPSVLYHIQTLAPKEDKSAFLYAVRAEQPKTPQEAERNASCSLHKRGRSLHAWDSSRSQ